jgi:antirestriction protein ArdC
MRPMNARPDVYQAVTELILQHLEQGVVPWRCPWNREAGQPRNFQSQKFYTGVNVILLGFRQLGSPWWLTYRQALAMGGQVRKGEVGSLIVKCGQFKPKSDALGHPVPPPSGESESSGSKRKTYLREYKVFNATQIDGIDFPTVSTTLAANSDERLERAEQLVAAMPERPSIHEGQRSIACYKPSTDTVLMPSFGSFANAERYYQTLFHELVHATGHHSRLNRESLMTHDGFGGKVYSQEELVAEMGAAFLGMEADIVSDQHEQSAAYLDGWLQVLRVTEHKRWIIQAASQAMKAADYVLNRQATADQEMPETEVTV